MASIHALAVIIAALAGLLFCSIHIDAAKVWDDVDNCGQCKLKCPKAPAHSDRTCESAKCGYKCKGSWRDCDYSKSNGCETNVEVDARNCGKCGEKCPVPKNSIATCSQGGKCGFKCNKPWRDCDNRKQNGCEANVECDPRNCGQCGKECPVPANSIATCSEGGKCGFKCKRGFKLSDNTCVENATISTCDTGFKDCDKLPSNGCEVNVNTDEKNCGTCGKVCSSLPNTADGVCIDGTCKITKCVEGFLDCDGISINGCEVNLRFNESSCATCTQACPTWAASTHTTACKWENDQCVISGCEEPFLDCDHDIRNGCESVSYTASAGCGEQCRTPCRVPANTEAAECVGDSNEYCGYTECLKGFADCDTVLSNGCEIDLSSDNLGSVRFCGACVNDSDCVLGPFTSCSYSILGSKFCRINLDIP